MDRLLSFLALYWLSFATIASQCAAVFPDGIVSHTFGSGTEIAFGSRTQLRNNPDTILHADQITRNGGDLNILTCQTADCSANNTPGIQLDAGRFQRSNSNTDVTLQFQESVTIGWGNHSGNAFDEINKQNASEATITFSDTHSVYFIDKLTLAFKNKLNIPGGTTLWINTLTTNNLSEINVIGSGSVVIYVNNQLDLISTTLVNSPGVNQSGDVSRLALYAYNDVVLHNNTTFSGLIYSEDSVHLGSATFVYGAVSAADVWLNTESIVTYDPAVASGGFNGFCDSAQAPANQCPIPSSIAGQVVFNEVSFHGQNSNNDWLEVYVNEGTHNLAGWTISREGASNPTTGPVALPNITISDNPSVGPRFVVFANSQNEEQIQAGIVSGDLILNQNLFILGNDIGLHNTRQELLLRDDNGNLVHYMSYANNSDSGNFVYNCLSTSPEFSDLSLINGQDDLICTFQDGVTSSNTDSAQDVHWYAVGDDAPFIPSCPSPGVSNAPSTDPVAFFQYEPGDFLGDSTGNNADGTAIGDISRVDLVAERMCSVLDVPFNSSTTDNDAFDTNVNVHDALGNRGTISFWYRSDRDWNVGSDSSNRRQLFDASIPDSNGVEGKFFFLSLQGDGRLVFGLEDANDLNARVRTGIFNFRAGEWVHLAVTWDMQARDIQIFVNGDDIPITVVELAIQGDLSQTNTLHIGDNRITNILGIGDTANSANGQFDDVRMYRFVQSEEQIELDISSQNLFLCEPVAQNTPLAFYQFEEVNPTHDSIGNNDGNFVGRGIDVQQNENRFCSILDIPHNLTNILIDAFDTGVDVNNDLGDEGTISFWYRSDERFDSGNPRVLFDASNGEDSGFSSNNDLNRRFKWFYMAINHNGRLEFSYEDTHDSEILTTTNVLSNIEANEWVHIAAVWDTTSQIADIYVNGQRANRSTSLRLSETARAAGQGFGQALNINGSGHIGGLLTLFIGDNRLVDDGRVSAEASGLTQSANGQFDDLRLYNIAQTQRQVQMDADATLTICQSLDVVNHYRLNVNSRGYTCAPSQVDILACANQSCSELSQVNSSLNFTATNAGVFNPQAISFAGAGSSLLTKTTPGISTIGTQNVFPSAPVRCFVDGNESNTCAIDFSLVGLEVLYSGASTTGIPNGISQTGLEPTITVRVNPVCSANLQGRQLQVAVVCENPASCNADQLTVGNTLVPDPMSFANLPAFGQNISFDQNGEAVIPANLIRYDDAGEISLLFRDFDPLTGISLASGQSNSFVRAPSTLVGTFTEAGPYIAGVDYPISYEAVGALNLPTPNYQPSQLQLDAQKVIPDGQGEQGQVTLGAATVLTSDPENALPNDVASDALSFVSGQTDGISIRYSEAGNFDLQVSDVNYLMSGVSVLSNRLSFGPFLPAYLAVSSQAATVEQCGNQFNYFGQNIRFSGPVSATLVPMNALQQQIRNFDSPISNSTFFVPDTNALGSVVYTDDTSFNDADIVLRAPGAAGLTNSNSYDGEFSVEIANNEFAYLKSNTPVAPLNNSVVTMSVPSDLYLNTINGHPLCIRTGFGNGFDCQGIDFDSQNAIQLRWGRLNFANSSGPETATLRVPFQAEYFDGSRFVLNTEDVCTSVRLQYSSDGSLGISTLGVSDFGDTSVSSLITNIYSGIEGDPLTTDILLMNGEIQPFEGLYVSPINTSGTVELLIFTNFSVLGNDWRDYLNFDWDGDGVIESGSSASDDFPRPIVTFGQFRGNDRIINWREVFND